MTDAQRTRLYFPAWHLGFRASWEKDLTGALILSQVGALNDWAGEVDLAARVRICRHSVPTADDLRKAGHLVAVGRPMSSKEMTNRQLDRVLVLWRLLTDPTDLHAVIAWQQSGRPDETRLRWCVEHCGFESAYIAALCRDRFGTSRWETLDIHRLHQLVVTLEERRRARKSQVSAQPMSPDPAIAPDPTDPF